MKAFLLAAVFSMIGWGVYAQNAWQDAKKLNRQFEFNPAHFRAEIDNSEGDEDTVSILQILVTYCPEAVDNGQVSKTKLDACYKANPFISIHQYPQSRMNSLLASFLPTANQPEKDESRGPGGGPLAGGNFITNLADGLAIFLVKRTKEELNATFFDGLRKKMDNESVYRALFPTTAEMLSVIGSEIYNYNVYIESLRDGFRADLRELPLNLKQFALDNNYVKKPELQIAVEDLMTLSQMVIDANKPVDMLAYLSGPTASIQDSVLWQNITNPKTRHAMQDMAMSLRTFNILVNSLTRYGGEDWVSVQEVKREMNDISHVYLYLGLLWQQGEGIRFSDGGDFRSSLGQMAKLAQTPIELRNYLVSLVQTGTLLQQRFRQLLDQSMTEGVLNGEYARFADLLFDLLAQARSFQHLIVLSDWKITDGKPVQTPKTSSQTKQTDSLEHQLVTAAKQLFDLEFNVKRGHYSLAVMNLTHLLEVFLSEDQFKFKKQFLRHVNFMATVAEAKDSKEVAAAIELFALPPGSSRMKKESPFSISLNTYGGLAYGREHDLNDQVDEKLKDGKVFAPSAPIGIDFNFGLKNAGSLSLYAQAIDVGALFAYRFSDETSAVPELKFQNIVAPGGYLIYGFGNNIPVSFGIGAQLGPNLRKIDDSLGLDVKTTKAWRFGIMAAVDIPVTHFYSR